MFNLLTLLFTVGMCDVFCTAGERHLKVWAFNREAVNNPKKVVGDAALVFNKAVIMGKITADKAKTFLSVSFAEAPIGTNGVAKSEGFDLLVCGINGMVYKFRQGVCVLAVSVSTGPVSCGYICGGRFIIGAALGQVKVLDRHTLAELTSYSVHPNDSGGSNIGIGARPGTGFSDAGGRPCSSSGMRPSSAGFRPSTASGGPSIAAGGAASSRTPTVTRKARVPNATKGPDGKPMAAWGGPSSGFLGEKCSQPLPPATGVKASTNVIGLVVEMGSYSSQVCFFFIEFRMLLMLKFYFIRIICKQ